MTEYGVHWNFFFTLALLPVFGALAERWSDIISFKYMALFVTTLHQLLLISTPLQTYTLNGQRPNLFAQNKEGLVSFAGECSRRLYSQSSDLTDQTYSGYLAIYLLGYDTGLYVLPPDPYFIRRRDKHDLHENPNLGKLMNVLFSYAVLWWGLFGMIHLLMPEQYKVSRRLVRRLARQRTFHSAKVF